MAYLCMNYASVMRVMAPPVVRPTARFDTRLPLAVSRPPPSLHVFTLFRRVLPSGGGCRTPSRDKRPVSYTVRLLSGSHSGHALERLWGGSVSPVPPIRPRGLGDRDVLMHV